jgi:hypothetical protein
MSSEVEAVDDIVMGKEGLHDAVPCAAVSPESMDNGDDSLTGIRGMPTLVIEGFSTRARKCAFMVLHIRN